MNTRKFTIPDEFEHHHYIELMTDQRKRSVTINAYSMGQNTTVTVDMVKLKQAMEDMGR